MLICLGTVAKNIGDSYFKVRSSKERLLNHTYLQVPIILINYIFFVCFTFSSFYYTSREYFLRFFLLEKYNKPCVCRLFIRN